MNLFVQRAAGYTLVEISVVLVIISLLTAGGLTLGTGMVNQAAHIDTAKILDQLNQSLKDYYVVNGVLPCPAPLDTAINNSAFGDEVNGGSCAPADSIPGGTEVFTTATVITGMIPVRTLGLSSKSASDKYGNRIVYSVTRGLTDESTFGTTLGTIRVNDGSGNAILLDAAFFLASPGKNHLGAYAYSTGNKFSNCTTASNLDGENCDYNGNAIFRDAPFNNGNTASFFDDLTRWAPRYHLTAQTTSSSSLWSADGAGADIYSVGTDGQTATGNVGIGTDNPSERLSVKGNVAIESDWGGTPYEMKLIGPHIVTDNPDGSLVLNFPPSGADNGLHVRSNNTAGDPGTYKEVMVVRPNGTMAIGDGLSQPFTPAATLEVQGKIRGELDCRQVSTTVGYGVSGAHSWCGADEYVISGGGQCGDQTNDHIAINRPWGNGWVAGCKRPSGGAAYYTTSSWAICCKY